MPFVPIFTNQGGANPTADIEASFPALNATGPHFGLLGGMLMSATMPTLGIDATASMTEPLQADISIDFPAFGMEMSGSFVFTEIDIELPSLVSLFHGGANLIPVLSSLSLQGSGTSGHAGELSFSFPKLSCEIHTGGQATVEFPGMSLEMTAVSTVVAEISLQFPVLGFSGVAARASEGDIDITLPMLQAAMEMTVGIVGSISGRLPRFSMGIVGLLGATGDLEGTFRLLKFSATGGPSGPGEISAELPILEMTLTSGAIESDVLRYNWERVT